MRLVVLKVTILGAITPLGMMAGQLCVSAQLGMLGIALAQAFAFAGCALFAYLQFCWFVR